MEPLRDDQLIADLHAVRPIPRPQFAAELDERAAAGFPRRSWLPRPSLARWRKGSPRRLLVPAGVTAAIAIAIATAVVATNSSEQGSGAEVAVLSPEEQHHSTAPAPASEGSAGSMYESELPSVPSHAAESEGMKGGTGYGAAAGSTTFGAESQVLPSKAPAPEEGSFRIHHRAVERSAEIVLGAAPDEVADDAAKVFEAVHANDGIVMRSSTRQGKAGEAGATFNLLIPSAKLGDALAAFSQIDAVRARHEATADITHPTVAAAELLRESRARIDSLLGQLEAAELESELEAVEAELRLERRRAARLAAQLGQLHRRASFSRVSLRIETGAAREPSSGGGAWGVDDALHDAGHVLTIAAAVTLIVLAILGPIALTALLAWLTHRAWIRRERRRVLS
jgi:hypothetical protein